MNCCVELHDSTIAAILWEGRDLLVRFSPASLHGSAGQPGIDPGSGWLQDLDLRVAEAIIQVGPPQVPCEVCDGSLMICEQVWRNEVPLPLASPGPVVLSLLTAGGEHLLVRGVDAAVILHGEPTFLEEVDLS